MPPTQAEFVTRCGTIMDRLREVHEKRAESLILSADDCEILMLLFVGLAMGNES